VRIRLPGRYDWVLTPDEWEYQPDEPLEQMGLVRRSLFVLMHFATLAGILFLVGISL
jgi:hypothetical protein